jgi:hypothetical protein
MTSRTRRDRSDSNRISRFVTIPRRTPSSLVCERRVRPAGHGVGDHAGLRPLDEIDLLRLLLDGEVAVQDADTALAGHGNGHARLGDGIHRAGDERDAEPAVAGDQRAGVRLTGHQLRVRRQQQHIVKRQAYRDKLR